MLNKTTKMLLAVAYILLVASILVLIISSTVNIYAHSPDLYRYGFAKYQISRVTGISHAQLEEVAQKMVGYFNANSQTPQVVVDKGGLKMPVYSEKELVHLEDVGKIIFIFKILQILSIVIFLMAGTFIFMKDGIRKLLRGIQIGSIATAALMGLIIIWALIDFDSLFFLFHLISFSNDLWLLDPSKDYLIMMFPQGFFFDASVFVIVTIIIEALVLWLIAFAIRKIYLPGVPAA
jgi:integral membrane protein (TIGR01906 family)